MPLAQATMDAVYQITTGSRMSSKEDRKEDKKHKKKEGEVGEEDEGGAA